MFKVDLPIAPTRASVRDIRESWISTSSSPFKIKHAHLHGHLAPFILPVAPEFEPSVTGNFDLTRSGHGLEVCFQSKARVRLCKLETGGIVGLHAAN